MITIREDLLTPNIYSRPGRPISAHLGLVWHWVANPGTTAKQNRDYFENQRYQGRYCGAHYIIGLQGEILRCIPDNEIAYHAGATRYKDEAISALGPHPNNTTIGIEICHPDASGEFSGPTIAALIDLSAMLCHKYGLPPCVGIWRHYDITGKLCPKWYVEDEHAYNAARGAVVAGIEELKKEEYGA